MPRLNEFLFYRILDVSSVKMVVNTMKPKLFYKKKGGHRALDDIRESIGELQYYYSYAFKWFYLKKQINKVEEVRHNTTIS